jgi:hypothetical protein
VALERFWGKSRGTKIINSSSLTLFLVAGARGFEPRLTDPKTGVLPLDDAPTAPSCPKVHRAGCSVPNGSQTVKKKPTLSAELSLGRNTCASPRWASDNLELCRQGKRTNDADNRGCETNCVHRSSRKPNREDQLTKTTTIDPKPIDQLLEQTPPEDLLGENGSIKQFAKNIQFQF